MENTLIELNILSLAYFYTEQKDKTLILKDEKNWPFPIIIYKIIRFSEKGMKFQSISTKICYK